MTLKLYHISQEVHNDYDTYSDCVVAAKDEADARMISPDGGDLDPHAKSEPYSFHSWATDPKDVTAVYIGEAAPDIERGVICASFHAG